MTPEDLQFYGEFAPALEANEKIMLTEVQRILDSISTDSETRLAEHIKSRIKSSGSLCEKLERQGLPVSAESGLRDLSDIIGLRVVTHFVGDIYTVLEKIENSTVPFGVGGIEEIRTEIQLRTIAMDCWASLEHQLKYKKNIGNTELIVSELKRCADEMASTDLSMQTIRDLIHKGD